MNGTELVTDVRGARETELSRLGSEKAVVAATDARLEPGPVLSAAARPLDGGAGTLAGWADGTDDERARTAFADVADDLADHRDAILDLDDAASAGGDVPYLVDELRTAATTPERVAAGLVAYPLVVERLLLQVINVLVNGGDRSDADVVREARAALQAIPEEGATLLDAGCVDDGDWVTAQTAATDAIGTAYDEYASRLEELGLDPKPVC